MSVRIVWPPGYPDTHKAETRNALHERMLTDALGHDSTHVVSHEVNGREILERWAFAGIECRGCFGRWPTWYMEGSARASACPHCDPAEHVAELDSCGRTLISRALVKHIAAESESTQRVEFAALIDELARTSAVHSLHVAWDRAQELGQTDPARWHNPQDSKLIRALVDSVALYDRNLRDFFRRYWTALLPHLTDEQREAIDRMLATTDSP